MCLIYLWSTNARAHTHTNKAAYKKEEWTQKFDIILIEICHLYQCQNWIVIEYLIPENSWLLRIPQYRARALFCFAFQFHFIFWNDHGPPVTDQNTKRSFVIRTQSICLVNQKNGTQIDDEMWALLWKIAFLLLINCLSHSESHMRQRSAQSVSINNLMRAKTCQKPTTTKPATAAAPKSTLTARSISTRETCIWKRATAHWANNILCDGDDHNSKRASSYKMRSEAHISRQTSSNDWH